IPNLQIQYSIQNFHFAVLFIPFIYIQTGGGYCIGFLCEPHRVSFSTNLITFIFLTGTLGGLFIQLLFLRHQNLVIGTSRVKFDNSHIFIKIRMLKKQLTLLFAGILTILMTCSLIHPARLSVMNTTSTPSDINQTMQILCNSCDWIEKNRNYGVIPMEDPIVCSLFLF
ncbi:hypothetical protein PENTCL1PPCAC_12510, partial [Pristionchus entomophagus]